MRASARIRSLVAPAPRRWLALPLLGSLAACAGPSLTVHSPTPPYVDGAVVKATTPFRYYGTRTVDVMPGNGPDGAPDWDHVGTRVRVVEDEPVTPWLFPFDFALEVLVTAAGGNPDRRVDVVLPESPTRVARGFAPAGTEPLHERALAARWSR